MNTLGEVIIKIYDYKKCGHVWLNECQHVWVSVDMYEVTKTMLQL